MISSKNDYKGVRLMRKTLTFMITLVLALAVFQNAFSAPKARSAISPYMQTDTNSTYTFVGITHPSLNTAATQIGLTVATVGITGATPSTTFTVAAGETYRIFVVSTNHSTINSSSVTGDRVIFLSTTTGSTAAGQILFTANTVDPTVTSRQSTSGTNGLVGKLEGLNQLSLWGAIVIPSTSTGFAMEFIGDAHDSASLQESGVASAADVAAKGLSRRADGRGIAGGIR